MANMLGLGRLMVNSHKISSAWVSTMQLITSTWLDPRILRCYVVSIKLDFGKKSTDVSQM